MINLLPISQVNEGKLGLVKHWVRLATTIALVVYVLVLAALAGGGWYLADRQQTVSAEVVDLTNRVNQLAQMEAIVRQQDDRAKLISQTLANRPSLAGTAGQLVGAEVVGWEYLPKADHEITVVGSDAQALESYAQNLKEEFNSVNINSLSQAFGELWQMELLLGDEK